MRAQKGEVGRGEDQNLRGNRKSTSFKLPRRPTPMARRKSIGKVAHSIEANMSLHVCVAPTCDRLDE